VAIAPDVTDGRADETCTQWDIIYTLSHHVYRIQQSDATSQPC
jgi:hypothetical protein